MNQAGNPQTPKTNNCFWKFRNLADGQKAELLLYGNISESSWWGDEVTPKQFADDLAALGDVQEITVYINSGGGDEFVVFSKADAAVCEARMQAVSSALAAQDYSISYGIAVCEAANGLRELVREADEKMLGSKRAYYAEHDRRRPR